MSEELQALARAQAEVIRQKEDMREQYKAWKVGPIQGGSRRMI